MTYPKYFQRTYVNPSGNIAASGYYMSHITQEIANKYPSWHDIRDNNESVGQQFISPFAKILRKIEDEMAQHLDNSFISLARVDEVDVLHRMKVPSTISFLNNQYIECWTAPSGATPSGYPFPEPVGANSDTYNQIQLGQVTDLEEFYYYLIPTRVKAYNEEPYTEDRLSGIGITIPTKPSGIVDTNQKYIDRAKKEHSLTWAHDDGVDIEYLHRQDSESLESYDTYKVGASGYIKGFTLDKDYIWWIGATDESRYYLNLSSAHPAPSATYLDHIATYDITEIQASGTEVPDDYSITGMSAHYYGTNYTAISDGELTEVWAYVSSGIPGFDMQLKVNVFSQITALSTLPMTPIATSAITAGVSPSGGWYKFTFSTPLSITSGTTYAFSATIYGGVHKTYYQDTAYDSFFYNASGGMGHYLTMYTDRKYLFYIKDLFDTGYDIPDVAPSGVSVDEEGHLWILDEDRRNMYSLDVMNDYYLVDKENRFIYFREDYSDPGVFVKEA